LDEIFGGVTETFYYLNSQINRKQKAPGR